MTKNPEKTQPKKRKQGRPTITESNTIERRQEIKTIIEKVGRINFSPKAAATKWGVDESTIYQDLDVIMPQLDIIDGEFWKFELGRGYKTILADSWKHFIDQDLHHKHRAQYGQIALRTMDSMAKFLGERGVLNVVENKDTDSFRNIIMETIREEDPDLFKKIVSKLKATQKP